MSLLLCIVNKTTSPQGSVLDRDGHIYQAKYEGGKGEWTSTKGVNLTTAGTKVVVGELGSKLVFNNVENGLYYATAPTGPDYYMRGVNVTVGTGTGTGTGYGAGFYSCTVVIGCKAGKHCSTTVFQNCYASSSETSTYACADTANSGFNNTTNPAA